MSSAVVRAAPRGLLFGRVAKATMVGMKGNGDAESVFAYASAQGWGDTAEWETVVKASVDPVSGSALVPTPLSADAIELVRPLTLLDRITGFRPAPLYISILKFNEAFAAGFVGRGQSKPIRAASLERVTLEPYKLVSIYVATEELVRGPTAPANLRLPTNSRAGLRSPRTLNSSIRAVR